MAAGSAVDHIRIMPAAQSPFKTHRDHAEAHHRLAMLELTLETLATEEAMVPGGGEGESNGAASVSAPEGRQNSVHDTGLRAVPVVIDTYELNEGGISYSVRTIRHLQKQGLDPILVIGADNLYGLEDWKEHTYLLENVAILVFMREGQSLAGLEYQRGELQKRYAVRSIELLDICPPGCASSDIRQALIAEADLLNPEEAEQDHAESFPRNLIARCLSEPVLNYIKGHGLYQA
tara:strand:- start:86891 stop:87592 length:702 start_codon:yes stop_codon:yes gene_type:complete